MGLSRCTRIACEWVTDWSEAGVVLSPSISTASSDDRRCVWMKSERTFAGIGLAKSFIARIVECCLRQAQNRDQRPEVRDVKTLQKKG